MSRLSHPDPAELAEHYPSKAERRADKAVHLIGIGISAAIGAGLFAHALEHTRPTIAGAIALYAACAIAMLGCSAFYNLARPSRIRPLLRRLDQTAIFMMIAGTCTPYLLAAGPHRWESAALEWAMAAIGDEPVPTSNVADELGRKPSSLSPARDGLIKKGLIYSSERGLIAFTVPHFGKFLRSQPV